MKESKRVALVTGASRGIGHAIARRFHAEGYAVAICGTRLETLKAASEAIGADVLALQADVSVREEAQRLVRQVLDHYGRLDVLVNNAGITRDNLALRMKPEEWQRVLDVNLSSVFYTSQAALKAMIRAKYGRIINVSSVVASMGNPGQVNYCASKGGMEAFTRALAKEVASRGITVNAVAPGFIATEMTKSLGNKETLLQSIPMARFGEPEDVANAVSFLASEKASYITGHVLHVNGGMYM